MLSPSHIVKACLCHPVSSASTFSCFHHRAQSSWGHSSRCSCLPRPWHHFLNIFSSSGELVIQSPHKDPKRGQERSCIPRALTPSLPSDGPPPVCREKGLAQDHMPCQGETQVSRQNVPLSIPRKLHGVLKWEGLGWGPGCSLRCINSAMVHYRTTLCHPCPSISHPLEPLCVTLALESPTC